MKAIIIQDTDGDALLDSLKLCKLGKPSQSCHVVLEYDPEAKQLASATKERVLTQLQEEIHRQFHYTVTRWLQDQGYRTTR